MAKLTLNEILGMMDRVNWEYLNFGVGLKANSLNKTSFEIPKELIDARNEVAKAIKEYGVKYG